MNISELSLRRPVLAIVLNLVIIVFGVIAFKFLGVRDYPAIDPPNISVRTSYSGANSDIIESQITEPLEEAINGIPGIKNITSSSSNGSSSINVEFEVGADLEAAANDVRDKVASAQRELPDDLDAPSSVSKADASAEPILAMTVQSDSKNPLELSEYATNILVDRLQTIPGVSSIDTWGEKRFAMRLWIDPNKMTAFDVTPAEIQRALQRENVELPSGKLTGDHTELSIRTFGRLDTEEEFAGIVVKNVNGVDILVRDIANVVLGPENEETQLKESGVPMIALAIIPQPGANYVSISDEFYKRIEEIKKESPKDISFNIAMDKTEYIKKSILEVEETLFIAIGLVVLIIYLFFREWILSIRPLIDIPVSLIGAFFIMYIMGYTINVLSLLAIVLATGLVVDDGIVVTENIFKKLEQGMSKRKAALEGSKEIYFAVIATSITLAVVFLPIVFLQGFVGRLFREFGIVVAGAVLISAFVSLTLTPVLNVFVSKKDVHKKSWFYRKTEPFFIALEIGYARSLKAFMGAFITIRQRHIHWAAWLLVLCCFGIIFQIGSKIQSELAPMEDQSQFRLSLTAAEGTSFPAMDKYVDQVSQFMIDSVPEHTIVLSVAGARMFGGVNNGFVRVRLLKPTERTRSQKEIVQYVNKGVSKFTGGRAFAIEDQTIQVNRRGGQAVQFVLLNNNFDKLSAVLPQFLEEANQSTVLQQVDADLKFNKPELRVRVNRMKAAQLGVSIVDVSQALQTAYSNQRLGYFTKSGKQYQVMAQVDRINRDDPNDLKKIFVRNNIGHLISLDNITIAEESTTPPSIYHFNRFKSATISAGLTEGHTVGDGVKEMQRIASKVLDESFSTALTGSARDFAESTSNTSFAFLLALGLIYLILAAQFESFKDPLIIMITVPLALAGAFLSLWLFDQTLNIFSQIGMIMLIGLVTKNGILIVEFANQSRKNGMERNQAVLYAAGQRLRPILMTSMAMALGALPIALSFGAAATSRIPLGIVIVGGIIFSLVLTLYILPCIYSDISSRKKRKEFDEMLAAEHNSSHQIPVKAHL
ncbi:MAG TPA: efflux RND transporter permease subunit [Niabella sp.]|nr:efflux RND transporter permease subunit [Niabella sp.]HOZ95772.1 efflux RND transporter permease subunit [Niabella sp.]HQW13626.1 efflux RND transporter permease subunit [Niabella sp.]HQX19020.1 efflux RND transporter permease subunit [Niabella sp.]HQX40852.1 efflux RND transporter permease subunit [Niabella sp.]